MKRLIQTRSRTAEMLTLALTDGMVTLVQDGIRKALQGFTIYRQVRAVAMK
jgi:type II secretory ATPase GspE/PulE/Tfp pilus assembly ATPase PilB-like protein